MSLFKPLTNIVFIPENRSSMLPAGYLSFFQLIPGRDPNFRTYGFDPDIPLGIVDLLRSGVRTTYIDNAGRILIANTIYDLCEEQLARKECILVNGSGKLGSYLPTTIEFSTGHSHVRLVSAA